MTTMTDYQIIGELADGEGIEFARALTRLPVNASKQQIIDIHNDVLRKCKTTMQIVDLLNFGDETQDFYVWEIKNE